MKLLLCVVMCLSAALWAQDTAAPATAGSSAPSYTKDGRLIFPADYREWIYLTTGLDMDYNPDLNLADHSMFDNVFVNPAAYKAFVATGTWPDKTMLVLEGRIAASKGSINQKGHFQTEEVMVRSVHVKDESRFPGKWAFFPLDPDKPAKQIPKEAVCYSCHEQHGAVDTTFVQFYPTLLAIAKNKGTLAPNYVKETESGAKK
jgi:hypothetical protein